jgi:hypothetical protein
MTLILIIFSYYVIGFVSGCIITYKTDIKFTLFRCIMFALCGWFTFLFLLVLLTVAAILNYKTHGKITFKI